MSKKQHQSQKTWTLWERADITLTPGAFIEYWHIRQKCVARVIQVRELCFQGTIYSSKQVIDVKRYGSLRRDDGPRNTMVQPEEVICVLDGPPHRHRSSLPHIGRHATQATRSVSSML